MPGRGSFTTGSGDEYQYEIGDYRTTDGRDHTSHENTTWSRLNSSDIEFARVTVFRPGREDDGIWTTVYGPYLDADTLEANLVAAFDDYDYGELL